MPEITKKVTDFINAVDKLIEDGKKVAAAAMDIKESLPKKPKDKEES
jgi:hypothetical protein